jgi:hypothetical protein
MSKPLKVLLLLATLWPLIYIGMFFVFFVILFAFTGRTQFHGTGPPPPAFILIFILHFITMAWTLGLLVFYIINVFNKEAIRDTMKILWVILLIFGGPISMPIYWYQYIWKEPKVFESADNFSGLPTN